MSSGLCGAAPRNPPPRCLDIFFTCASTALERAGRVQPEQAICAIRAGLLDSALFSKRGATAQGALSKLKPSSLHLGISYA